jgi:acetyltransferase-like isoleucine patch superfamily enzyme
MTKALSFAQRAWRAAVMRWDHITVPVYLRCLGVTISGQPNFVGTPLVTLVSGSKIEICHDALLISRSFATVLGVSRPVILRTLSADAFIYIGDNVGLSGTTICSVSSITIGSQSMLGADVLLADTDFHPVESRGRRNAPLAQANSAPVSIGCNVFIGARSIVLKGVSIGDNTVIAAGSVVSKSMPSNVVAAGNPCRVIKEIG